MTQNSPPSADTSYNDVYERFVDHGADELQGYVAYALYKSAKREWVRQYRAENGCSPNHEQLALYAKMFTDQTMDAYRNTARAALVQFADEVVEAQRSQIVEEALKGNFVRAMRDGIAANVVYTLILLAFAFVLAKMGVDLVDAFENEPHSQPAAVAPPSQGNPPI